MRALESDPRHWISALSRVLPIREGDVALHYGAYMIGEPEPGTGITGRPVCVIMWLRWDDGERREQTVFLCDAPDTVDSLLEAALEIGIRRMEPTIRRRLRDKPRGDLTPQTVISPGPIQTAMNRVNKLMDGAGASASSESPSF